MKEKLEYLKKKYQNYIDNIEWHIKTNEPLGDKLAVCTAQIVAYKELVNDLESVIYNYCQTV